MIDNNEILENAKKDKNREELLDIINMKNMVIANMCQKNLEQAQQIKVLTVLINEMKNKDVKRRNTPWDPDEQSGIDRGDDQGIFDRMCTDFNFILEQLKLVCDLDTNTLREEADGALNFIRDLYIVLKKHKTAQDLKDKKYQNMINKIEKLTCYTQSLIKYTRKDS